MTNWTPDLDVRPGPRYLAIAVALGEAIARGELRPGDRLWAAWDLDAACLLRAAPLVTTEQ